ncbi:MAG: phospho-N-acetylmuramoyl-pentapeptide-transferase [Planctomycetota bacterium]
MLYFFVDTFQDWINNSRWLGALGVFRWIEFRAVLSIIVAFALVVGFGRRTIGWLVAKKIGDNPDFGRADVNELMRAKSNTPTMGGILIAGAIFASTLLLADLGSYYVRMALVCLVGMFLLGLADDWLKLTAARRKAGRQGLRSWEKLLFQVALAVILAVFIGRHGADKFIPGTGQEYTDMARSLTIPGLRTWVREAGEFVVSPDLIVLPEVVFVLVAVLVIVGSSNAVNLTDGMDGLASGVMVVVAFAFLVLCLIAGYAHEDFVLAKYLLVPHIPLSDELAVVAGAMVGACLGFLWFNCSPAQVFMGDTGSLPLGALLGYLAVVIRQELLLLVIGGVFVLEALSVLIQVGYFKLTRGRRVFKCAPIHHHFHLSGWTEQQTVVRFWLLTVLLAAIALATVKVR